MTEAETRVELSAYVGPDCQPSTNYHYAANTGANHRTCSGDANGRIPFHADRQPEPVPAAPSIGSFPSGLL